MAHVYGGSSSFPKRTRLSPPPIRRRRGQTEASAAAKKTRIGSRNDKAIHKIAGVRACVYSVEWRQLNFERLKIAFVFDLPWLLFTALIFRAPGNCVFVTEDQFPACEEIKLIKNRQTWWWK
jgi:hypothetical protein